MITWVELNKRLRDVKDEHTAYQMFLDEQANHNRPRWLKRIWSRFRTLRTAREKKELFS